jgi:hypothetical protein
LFTPVTTWSPVGCAILTVSLFVLPSEPGAPFGQRSISGGAPAASTAQGSNNTTCAVIKTILGKCMVTD